MAVPEISLTVALDADLTAASSGWTWTEIGDRARSIRWQGPRRSTIAGQIQAGALTVELDNADGLLDPRDTAGAFTAGGVSRIRPRLPVWFRARYPSGGGSYTGLGMGYKSRGVLEDRPPADSIARWDCPDGMFRLAIDRGGGSAAGADDLTGTRVGRILDSISWPAGDRSIDAGLTRCAATTLTGSALTELQQVAETEQGDLFITGDGAVRFIGRQSRLIPGSVDYAFSDASSTMDHATFALTDDDTTIINRALISRGGGTVFQKDDTASQVKFGLISKRIDTVANDDPWCTALAEGLVLTYADWAPRVESITLEPSVNDSLWSTVLAIKMGDYVTVTDDGYTRSCWVEGVDHEVTALRNSDTMRWVTTVWTTDFGTARAYNVWDTAVWDTAVWGW